MRGAVITAVLILGTFFVALSSAHDGKNRIVHREGALRASPSNPRAGRTPRIPSGRRPGPFRLVEPADGASGVDASAVTFRWTPSAGAAAYRLVVADAADEKMAHPVLEILVPAPRTAWTVAGVLEPTRTYRWTVTALARYPRAVGPNARGADNGPFVFATVVRAPGRFELVRPRGRLNALYRMPPVRLEWTDARGETGYTVEVDDAPDFTTPVWTAAVARDVTRVLVPAGVLGGNGADGRRWWWRVVATSPAGTRTAGPAAFRIVTPSQMTTTSAGDDTNHVGAHPGGWIELHPDGGACVDGSPHFGTVGFARVAPDGTVVFEYRKRGFVPGGFGAARTTDGGGCVFLASEEHWTQQYGWWWLVRFDAAGNIVWGVYTHGMNSLARLTSGDYLVAGSAGLIGSTTYMTEGLEAARIAPDGTVVWDRRYRIDLPDPVLFNVLDDVYVRAAPDGGAYIVAQAYLHDDPSTADRHALWVLRIDGAGNVLWHRLLQQNAPVSGRQDTGPDGAVLRPDGRLLVVGGTDIDPEVDGYCVGSIGTDFLLRFDPDGTYTLPRIRGLLGSNPMPASDGGYYFYLGGFVRMSAEGDVVLLRPSFGIDDPIQDCPVASDGVQFRERADGDLFVGHVAGGIDPDTCDEPGGPGNQPPLTGPYTRLFGTGFRFEDLRTVPPYTVVRVGGPDPAWFEECRGVYLEDRTNEGPLVAEPWNNAGTRVFDPSLLVNITADAVPLRTAPRDVP